VQRSDDCVAIKQIGLNDWVTLAMQLMKLARFSMALITCKS
jgi:hypothetical protein